LKYSSLQTNITDMTNTDSYQVLPDFFSSKEEGKNAVRENTNPRYKFFRQTHFTAGDYEQFLEHWDSQSHRRDERTPDETILKEMSPLYRDLTTDDIIATFEHLFHKFKKGIYVKIVSGELRVFLPFSKIDYTNEWSEHVRVDPKKYPKGVFSMIEASTVRAGYHYDPSKIHFMMDHWYGNNGLLRYEYPISESDSGIPTLHDMLVCLVRERRIPDAEFFINKRDFPILHRRGMEAYDCIYGGNTPLVSHRHEKYAPILGMTTTKDHADLAMPTWEDWARVSYPSKVFGKEYTAFPDPYVADYRSKKSTAIFRGASTGLGTSLRDNPRLFFSMLSMEEHRDVDGELFLDCGITKWNLRPRRAPDSPYYDTIDAEIIKKLKLASYMDYREQASHKFILHLPGHSEAYRLSSELGMNSVILLYPCRYKIWYRDQLLPYVHYVPLEGGKEDLWAKIRWCKAHEKECEAIARNARVFYETVLSREGILDYLERLLIATSSCTGPLVYPRRNMLDFQDSLEAEFLKIESNVILNHGIRVEDLDTYDLRAMHPRTFQVLLRQMDPTLIQKKMREAPVLKQSRSMSIRRIEIARRPLCVKTPLRSSESLIGHECFVGQIGMNRVANVLQMVVFTYGRWEDHILMDFIEGETMEQMLTTTPTAEVVTRFLTILQQLSLLLNYLQNEFGFIHLDLYPWNVMIRKNTEGREFEIPIDTRTKSCRFTPDYYPVLIDFGKSHILYQNSHFVRVSPFKIHLHQDILSILISGLFIVVQQHKINSLDISRVLRLMNYIGGTSYTGFKTFDRMGQLKAFLKLKKKYSNMLVDDKEEFRHHPPIRFYSYLVGSGLIPALQQREHGCNLGVDIEVYYSRFVVAHEMSRFHTPIYEVQKKTSNPMNRLYRDYIEYHIMGIVDPSRQEEIVREMTKTAMMPWPESTITTTAVVCEDICFPRFMTHPNMREIRKHAVKRSSNHFFEKHKILRILLHATHHFRFMEPLRSRIGAGEFTYFLGGILGPNRVVSISNHMCRYKEWEEKKN